MKPQFSSQLSVGVRWRRVSPDAEKAALGR